MNDWLIKLGLTRDSKLWFWSRVTAVAALIVSGAIDITGVSAGLGVEISPTVARWITGMATALLWLSGKYDTSPLPAGKQVDP